MRFFPLMDQGLIAGLNPTYCMTVPISRAVSEIGLNDGQHPGRAFGRHDLSGQCVSAQILVTPEQHQPFLRRWQLQVAQGPGLHAAGRKAVNVCDGQLALLPLVVVPDDFFFAALPNTGELGFRFSQIAVEHIQSFGNRMVIVDWQGGPSLLGGGCTKTIKISTREQRKGSTVRVTALRCVMAAVVSTRVDLWQNILYIQLFSYPPPTGFT
jgi:hypothetical protein